MQQQMERDKNLRTRDDTTQIYDTYTSHQVTVGQELNDTYRSVGKMPELQPAPIHQYSPNNSNAKHAGMLKENTYKPSTFGKYDF